MRWDEERRARAALSRVVAPGDPKVASAVEEFGAAQVWHGLLGGPASSALARRARGVDVEALVELADRLGVQFLVPGDPQWPTSLDDLSVVGHGQAGGRPSGLWVSGCPDLSDLVEGSVGIVGCRAATSYGQDVATQLGYDLAGGGRGHPPVTVVSGGAFGIDVAAHRGALAAQGRSVAVLAGGLDELYPRGNVTVLDGLRGDGALVSEVAPGVHPTRPGFLARNRVIAALTSGTVVVEAGLRSGALNTVAWAQRLGRPVMAVPGPVTSSRSWGPHQLIRDAEAVLVRGVEDVRSVVGEIEPDPPRPAAAAKPTDDLPADLLAVHEAMPGSGSVSADELVGVTGMRMGECLAVLVQLEAAGLVRSCPDGRWALERSGQRGTADSSSSSRRLACGPPR